MRLGDARRRTDQLARRDHRCQCVRIRAVEQLDTWAQRLDVEIVKQPMGSDPAAVAFDALAHATARGHDVVIVDTAGRLQTKEGLMRELEKVRGVLAKRVEGRARLTGAHEIEVAGQRFEAGKILIATGGYPIVPELPGAELGITSDGFFELETRPQRVLIAGSGYVAVELGGVFRALGSEVTLLTRQDGVLRTFDPMLREVLMDEMRKQGIDVRPGFEVVELAKSEKGISLRSKHVVTLDGFDTVVWAVGRRPNTAGLNLEAAGVDTVKELAQRRADNLYKKMVEVNEAKKLVRALPSENTVAKWVEQAKALPRAVHY